MTLARLPRADLMRAIAEALRQLRESDATTSETRSYRAAASLTEGRVSPTTLYAWEHRQVPMLDTLIYALYGMGYTLADFEAVLLEIVAEFFEEELVEELDDPAAAISAQLAADPELRARLYAFLEHDPAAGELRALLEAFDRSPRRKHA